MMERSKKVSTTDGKELNMIDVSFKQEKNDKNSKLLSTSKHFVNQICIAMMCMVCVLARKA
jgi:hypothetical protein